MFEMLPTFDEVFKSFEDPQRLHAILVHIPIAVAVLGLILTLGVVLTGSKASGLRWTTIFIFLLGTLSALWASYTGEEAEHHLPIKPTGEAYEVLEKHEQLAEYFWVSLAAIGFFILLSTVRVTWFRSVALVFALLASVASVAWVGAIGHYGGELVYRHSVGVPSAGSDHVHSEDDKTTDGKSKDGADAKDKTDTKDGDAVKDKVDAKDKAVVPPTEKDSKTKKDAVKDKKDETPEKDSGERKLPPVESKDKSIFD